MKTKTTLVARKGAEIKTFTFDSFVEAKVEKFNLEFHGWEVTFR